MKKLSGKIILLVMMTLCFTLFVSGPAPAKTEYISIGTGGTGGIYYPYGGGVAEIWNKYVPEVRAVAEVTGASVENVKLADKGETVIGEVMGDVAVAGFDGLSKFKGQKQSILSMAIMYPNLLQVVALKKSGITDIEQVKGKKISSGSPGSGTNFMAETVFKALGIPLDSYSDSRLSFTETANALKDGTIEVGIWSVGPGTSSILDLATTHNIHIIGGQQGIFRRRPGRRCVSGCRPARCNYRCLERDDLPEITGYGSGLPTGESPF
jgi:TRAP transporter TAXI family solute receptor